MKGVGHWENTIEHCIIKENKRYSHYCTECWFSYFQIRLSLKMYCISRCAKNKVYRYTDILFSSPLLPQGSLCSGSATKNNSATYCSRNILLKKEAAHLKFLAGAETFQENQVYLPCLHYSTRQQGICCTRWIQRDDHKRFWHQIYLHKLHKLSLWSQEYFLCRITTILIKEEKKFLSVFRLLLIWFNTTVSLSVPPLLKCL